MAKPRVAAIGIDAAEWRDVEAHVDAGLLPSIEKFLATSTRLELHGEMPYRAEATWTEFLTGRAPGESRYWSTALFDPRTYQAWEAGAYRGAPFYARPDVNAIVFDVPHSHVAPEAQGLQVTAWGAHSPQFPTASSPRDLAARIDQRFGVHRAPLSDSWDGWHNEDYGRNLTEAMVDGLARKADICAWLLDELPDWDLFVTVLSETHTAGHQFLHGVLEDHPLHDLPLATSAARHFGTTYSKVDDCVGRLLATFDDDTIVVLFAVHGMSANGSDTANVWLPELLHRLTFGRPFIDFPDWRPDTPLINLEPEMLPIQYLLRYLTEPRGTMYGSRREAVKNRLAWQVRRQAPGPAVEAIEGAWRRASGKRSQHVWWEMDVRPPASPWVDLGAAGALRPCDYHVPGWFCEHWPRMRYFVIPSFSDVHIRVNLRGREREGLVEPGEYHDVLDEVDELLGAITDARTGRRVVGDTYRVRGDDPMDPDGPSADLVVTLNEVADAVHHPGVGVIGPCPIFRSGEHSSNGWAAFRTPGGSQRELDGGRPRDLAPTILELLGRAPSPLVTGASFASLI